MQIPFNLGPGARLDREVWRHAVAENRRETCENIAEKGGKALGHTRLTTFQADDIPFSLLAGGCCSKLALGGSEPLAPLPDFCHRQKLLNFEPGLHCGEGSLGLPTAMIAGRAQKDHSAALDHGDVAGFAFVPDPKAGFHLRRKLKGLVQSHPVVEVPIAGYTFT